MGRKKSLFASPQALAGRKARERESDAEYEKRLLRNRLRAYGITVFEANEMLRAQDGGCAICREPISLEVRRQAHVDHSHRTGRVRGILCASCNQGLAYYSRLARLDNRVREYLAGEED